MQIEGIQIAVIGNTVSMVKNQFDTLLERVGEKAALKGIEAYKIEQSKKRILNPKEAAALMGKKSPRTFIARCEKGQIKGAYQEGKSWSISEYDLNKYIEKQKERYR